MIADGTAAQVESSLRELANSMDADTLQAEQERMRDEYANRLCRTCRTFQQPVVEPVFEKIDSAELARRWGVSESWVRNHTRRGCKDMIPHRKLGPMSSSSGAARRSMCTGTIANADTTRLRYQKGTLVQKHGSWYAVMSLPATSLNRSQTSPGRRWVRLGAEEDYPKKDDIQPT